MSKLKCDMCSFYHKWDDLKVGEKCPWCRKGTLISMEKERKPMSDEETLIWIRDHCESGLDFQAVWVEWLLEKYDKGQKEIEKLKKKLGESCG